MAKRRLTDEEVSSVERGNASEYFSRVVNLVARDAYECDHAHALGLMGFLLTHSFRQGGYRSIDDPDEGSIVELSRIIAFLFAAISTDYQWWRWEVSSPRLYEAKGIEYWKTRFGAYDDVTIEGPL